MVLSAARAKRPDVPWLLTALLLLWPAAYNGAPLIFADTLDFPAMILDHETRRFRSRGYGIAAGLPALALGSFWAVILAQAALTAWLAHRTLRALLPRLDRRGHRLAGAALALTTAPWAAAYVMPDALTAPGLLALFLLLSGRVGWTTATLAGAVVALAAAAHVTHALIMGCALAAVLILRLVPLRRAALGLACIAIGYAAVLGANRVLTGHAEYVRGGEVFLAARFAGDSLLHRYLDAQCPDARLPMLCAARPDLPRHADEFLWLGDSPLRPDGDMFAASDELRIANRAIMVAFWPDWLHLSIARAAHQLVLTRAGDGLEQELMAGVLPRVAEMLGTSAAALHAASRQARVEMSDDPLALAMAPAGLVGLILAPWLLLRRRDPGLRLLLALVLAAYAANALAVGAGGSVHARYSARIVWLLPFGAMAALLHGRFGAPTRGISGLETPPESGRAATDARFP